MSVAKTSALIHGVFYRSDHQLIQTAAPFCVLASMPVRARC